MVIHDKRKKIALGLVNFFIESLYFPVRLFSRKIDFEGFTPRKILLIRIDHIGDVVMTSPAFTLLKERYPESEILLLTSSAGRQLYGSHPEIDRVLEFNWPWSYQKSDNRFTVQKFREIYSLVSLLRKEQIDLFVDFRGDLRFVLLFGLFAGAKVRISNSRSGKSSLLHHIIPYDHDKHEVERSIEVLRCLVTPAAKYYPSLTLLPADIEAAQRSVSGATGISDFSRVALIAPYSSQHIKSWPDGHFQQVIRHLVEKDFTVLVMGTWEDEADAMQLVAPFPRNVFSIAGKTGIREAAALISMSAVIVGVDTGVLHLASCFDIPIVAIFGATRSLEYAPYSAKTRVVDSGLCKCDQFLHMKCDEPVSTYSWCLAQLTPDRVIRAVGEVLEAEEAKIAG